MSAHSPLSATSTVPASASPGRSHRSWLWLSWLVGAALLASVIAVALHLSDVESFARLLTTAEPQWLIGALVFQALTYLAQGQVFRSVLQAGQAQLGLWEACKLSLMKLFVDQALPSSGISGAFTVVASLLRRGLSRPVVLACLVLDLSAYFLAYVLAVGVALLILLLQGHSSVSLVAICLIFIACSLVLAIFIPRLSGHAELAARLPGRHRALFAKGLGLLTDADPVLVRNRGLLGRTTGLELSIIVLDCATLWVLVRAFGVSADVPGLFAGFMLASVLRSIGIVPGGLGTFEAAAVVTLHGYGVDIAVALSATLLFRGLTFWLPMLPGMWLARHEWKAPVADHQSAAVAYWSQTEEQLFKLLGSSAQGLSAEQVQAFPRSAGTLGRERPQSMLKLLLAQLRTPLVLVLIAGATVALVVRDWLDATIILSIVLISAALSASYESRASHAVEQLRRKIANRATVRREGKVVDIPAEQVVPGDILLLSAGSLLAADGRVLSARDCFVSQSLLTGETFPVEKQAGEVARQSSLAQRNNCVFMGTSVRSGTAEVLAVRVGGDTEIGLISTALSLRPPETEFERGLRHFGMLLLKVMLVITFMVFSTNILLHRPALDTLLFAIALSVGLSPELLPAILSITLAKGAQRMAGRGVIVRHLNAIENLGAMDILCTDKTGTLTRGVVMLDSATNVQGEQDPEILHLALLNASQQTGMRNAMDDAIVERAKDDPNASERVRKLDEIPYDFVRKRLSVVIATGTTDSALLITKGALDNILDVCSHLRLEGNDVPLGSAERTAIEQRFAAWSEQGFRVLGIASRCLPTQARYRRDDESNLVLRGFLLFFDPPEPGVKATIADLDALGVRIKIISGDSHLVVRHVAQEVGLKVQAIITGAEVAQMSDDALMHLAPRTTLFAEVDPNQKERIIRALQKTGHVVGFLGDGINDAPALQTADVGISVANAADVAKQAADFVLLEHDLNVLREGIEEGRHTFANTLKYISIVSSANFGNMISMAFASLMLPFLPLLAKQILLNNFLSDIPAMGIASDNVDREWQQTPHRWDIREIRNFMVVFGLVSSAFDAVTFGVLYLMVGLLQPELYRSGWFVESLLTQLLTIFIVRTYKPFHRSRPGRMLLLCAVGIAVLTLILPYSPVAAWFGLVPLPLTVLAAEMGISLVYVVCAEQVKRRFYRRQRRPATVRRRGDP
ncbi:MAG TPA: magnesium-translocating P-type ATPase [Pseudomonas sp.]|jgi:Mg2+-importing ATPase